MCEGSVWETRCYIVDSNKPGPVIMIVGGIHGDEPAGSRAAEQIRHWEITKGKLIVLPRANVPALSRKTRLMPDLPEVYGNLNRNFPQASGESGKCDLSKALWSVVCIERPDWLLDLHEGYDFTQINSKSVGSSLIAAESSEIAAQARRMLDAVNETIEDPNKKLVLKGSPATGSLARSAFEILAVKAMILETTYKEQPISLRTRQHRIMVHRLLRDLAMVSHGHDFLVGRSQPIETIRAALYDGGGVGSSLNALEEDLAKMERIVLRRIGEPEVAAGVLNQFDLLIVPGGSGSK
ncbi:MAG: succinylglutamate desuccinylase/aspartoacylase family protein, partial [Sedimentisphaerales bacterium]|nr:succinylglutamate desuccinylase/aspartoacylase family protein [Sedimentisphaerales bacterium]